MKILKRPLPYIALAVLAGCIFTLAIILFSNRAVDAFQEGTATPSPTRNPIATSPAPTSGQRPSTNRVRTTGTLASANQATMAFQAAGRVKEIRVKQGEKIKAGAVIASLDTTGLDAQVASAQANYDKVKAGPIAEEVQIAKTALDRAKAAVEQAQAAYDRIGGASNSGIAATNQALTLQQATFSLQEAIARYNLAINHPTAQELTAAAATLETAKVAAANARIVAPFDGTVVWISMRVGESVAVGTGVAAVVDLSRMQVQLNVDEISAATLQSGQLALVTVDAFPGRQIRGRVSSVAQFGIFGGTLVTVPVLVDLDGGNLPIFPGLSATVEIEGVAP